MDPEFQLRHIFAANNEQDEWNSDNEAPLEWQGPTFQPGFKAKVIKDNKKNVRMGNFSQDLIRGVEPLRQTNKQI